MRRKIFSDLLDTKNIVFFIFVILAFSLAWNTVKVIQTNHGLQKKVDSLEEEISVLELENQNLKLNIEYYKSDDFLELEAREKFNKAAKGETVLVLPERDDQEQPETAKKTEEQSDKPQYQQNFDQWMYFLFGREPS